MQTIKYRFADGTTSEIEVTDEFYTLYAELVQQEKRNHWKETRRQKLLCPRGTRKRAFRRRMVRQRGRRTYPNLYRTGR